MKKEIRKQKRRIYISSLFITAGMTQILWMFNNFFISFLWGLSSLIYAAILFGITYIPLRKYRLSLTEMSEQTYDGDERSFIRKMADRYTKRRLNGIAILFCVTFVFIFSELSFFIFGNSKFSEFIENFYKNIIVIEIPVYLCIKNRMCFILFQSISGHPDKKDYKKHIIGITAFSTAFWMCVTAVTFIFRDTFEYPGNNFLMAAILFMLLIFTYNLTLRKKITDVNIVVNKPRIAVFTSVILVVAAFSAMQRETWYTQSYINSVPVVEHNEHKIEYDEESGVYTITSSTDDFKILHLTDIHIGGSLYSYRKDLKALKACYAEIEYTHPDFVIVTGDLSFPLGIMSLSFNNTAPVGQFAAFMRNVDIPWAFTYGNHDTESLASAGKKELNEIYKELSYKTSGKLLYPYVQPDITGRNNQLIELKNSDGTLNTGLFLIDSNAYTGEGINVYDYIHDDQVE